MLERHIAALLSSTSAPHLGDVPLGEIDGVNLAATSSVTPLPAEATTSLLLIAFIGYLSRYEFSASRHFVDEEH